MKENRVAKVYLLVPDMKIVNDLLVKVLKYEGNWNGKSSMADYVMNCGTIIKVSTMEEVAYSGKSLMLVVGKEKVMEAKKFLEDNGEKIIFHDGSGEFDNGIMSVVWNTGVSSLDMLEEYV